MAFKKTEEKTEKPKDLHADIYAEYDKGKNCDTIAQERGLDSLEVLAIIQTVEQSRNNKG